VEHYFAYGTTQRGFTHHRRLAGLLGEPVGRFRTVRPFAVVVPREPACSNPGCPYEHRMAALVAGFGIHAEGDVFLIDDLAPVDELELAGPYMRSPVAVVSLDGEQEIVAHAYPVLDPDRWRDLVARSGADALPAYPPELATVQTLKECCRRAPGHPPPHDVSEPHTPEA
jgi:hypothetical protein